MSVARRTRAPRYMTVEEYLSGPPDKFSGELIYGELVMSPKPSEHHQDIVGDLRDLLKRWVRFHDLGKVAHDIDMVLDEKLDVVYAPDVLFVAKEHNARRRKGRLYGPADLCVEVLSPADRPRVPRHKYQDYARYGVTWYWTINPHPDEPVIEEHELVKGAYVLRQEILGNKWFKPTLFPGLEFSLPLLMAGNLKAAVRGKAKRLV